MTRTFLFSFLIIITASLLRAQTSYNISVPDSIKKKCDEVVISEIGKSAFEGSVKYIKSDLQKNNGAENYIVFYAFTFPNVKESHVIFTITCKLEGKHAAVVKDAAFKNYTRLPQNIKTKNVKVISYAEAKKIAVSKDPVLKKNESKLYGEISTDYDEKKKDYFFVWYFYDLEPCKDCPAGQYKTYSVYMDASTGKVIQSEAQTN